MTKSADPDQLASKKPTDLDLHCLQSRVYPGSAAPGSIISRSSSNALTNLCLESLKNGLWQTV